MSELAGPVYALFCGVATGALFYGGLWWTVQRGVCVAASPLWFSASLLLRLAGVLAGFYLACAGDPRALLPCFVGFLLARVAATWSAWRCRGGHLRQAAGESHAP